MSKEMNSILFHTFRPIIDEESAEQVGKERLFTVLFRKSQSNSTRIYMSSAVPHKTLDNFNRREGLRLATERMAKTFPEGYKFQPYSQYGVAVTSPRVLTNDDIDQYLPLIITPTLYRYVNKAMRAFKIEENVDLWFKSDRRKRDNYGFQDPEGEETSFICSIKINKE